MAIRLALATSLALHLGLLACDFHPPELASAPAVPRMQAQLAVTPQIRPLAQPETRRSRRPVSRANTTRNQALIASTTQMRGSSVDAGDAKAEIGEQLNSPSDLVALAWWEADVDERIRKAGEGVFNEAPGSARVALTLSPAGELLSLSVSGPAASMAEKAIRRVSVWPRFHGRANREFRRLIAFVIA